MDKIPKIKKNLKAFLTSEEGKITKKNALKLGVILTMIGATLGAKAVSAAHTSQFTNVAGRGQHTSNADTPP